LERLLSLRKHKEREWEIELAKITGTCVTLQNEIDTMAKQKATVFYNRYNRGMESISYLRSTELYMQRLDARTKQKQDELLKKSMEREKIKEKYLEASRERKVLDKLKDRRAEEYYREARDEEIKTVDEINTSLFGGSR
jgi:flagellar FliJ protein